MKAKINWHEDLWKSIEEKNVIQLRFRLNDIHIQNPKGLVNCMMNLADDKNKKA